MASSSESLGIVVDCGRTLSPEEFAAARDFALCFARRQLLYGKIAANGDKVPVFAIGAAETRNDFYDRAEDSSDRERYEGIAVVCPAARLSIDLLRKVRAMTQGDRGGKVLYTPGLDVAAGHLLERSGNSCSLKRVTLITDGKGRISGTRAASVKELMSFAYVCLEHDITFSAIFVDGLTADDWTALEDESDYHVDDSDTDSERDDDDSEDDEKMAYENGAEGSNAEGARSGEDNGVGEGVEGGVEGDSEGIRASKRRARRLFSGWRLDDDFARRKRVHEKRAAADCDHRMPTDGTLLKRTLLARLARVLKAGSLSLAEARVEIDKPRFKVKKPTVKFHGVLDIGNKIKIPVKSYTRVSAATRPSSKRLSWASTVAKRRRIYANSERRWRVPESDSDTACDADDGDDDEDDCEPESRDVEDEDVGDAVPYGPGLFEVPDETMGHSLNFRCDKEFSVISFVPKNVIPVTHFMGGVDVVLPMSGPEKCGPQRAMRSLVSTMLALECGAIARYCSGKGVNPKPEFMLLWPAKKAVSSNCDASIDEDDSDDEEDDIFFCYMVKLPLAQDVRDFPFASLQKVTEDIDPESQRHMNRFVAARDIDCDIPRDLMSQDSLHASLPESDVQPEGIFDGIADSEAPFDPLQFCNPAIDRFFVAIVQRALEGGDGVSGLPELPDWVKRLMNPHFLLRKANAVAAKKAVVALKNAFPLTKTEPHHKKRQEQRHVAAASGSQLDTSHLLPPSDVENERETDMERPFRPEGQENDDDGPEYGNATPFGDAPDARVLVVDEEQGDVSEDDEGSDDSGTVMNDITQCPMILSRETPVTDMKKMIRAKRADVAIETASDVVRALVRDGDVVLAGDWFVALRKASSKLTKPNTFNLLFDGLVGRLHKPSPQGNAATAFLRHMKRDPSRARHLAPLYPRDVSLLEKMDPAADIMRNVAVAIRNLSLDNSGGDDLPTNSGITASGISGPAR